MTGSQNLKPKGEMEYKLRKKQYGFRYNELTGDLISPVRQTW